jgi:hypothetical protein
VSTKRGEPQGAADGKSNSLVVDDSNAGIMAVKIAKNKR